MRLEMWPGFVKKKMMAELGWVDKEQGSEVVSKLSNAGQERVTLSRCQIKGETPVCCLHACIENSKRLHLD